MSREGQSAASIEAARRSKGSRHLPGPPPRMAAPCWPPVEELAFFSAAASRPAPSPRSPQLAAASLLAPDSAASDGAGSARTLYIVMAIIGVLIVVGVLGRPDARPAAPRGPPTSRRRAARAEPARSRPASGSASGRSPRPLRRRHHLHRQDDRGRRGRRSRRRSRSRSTASSGCGATSTRPPEETAGRLRLRHPLQLLPARRPGRHPDHARGQLRSTSCTAGRSRRSPRPSTPCPASPTRSPSPPTETGTFEGSSTRFSGPGYSTMRTIVEVVEPEEYEAFLQGEDRRHQGGASRRPGPDRGRHRAGSGVRGE